MKHVGWMVLLLKLCHIWTYGVRVFACSILDGCLLISRQSTSCDPASRLFFSSDLPGGIGCHDAEKQSRKHENVKAVMHTVEQVHAVRT